MNSLLQNKKECLITQSTQCLHKHHCFEGTANRKKSEKWNLYVYFVGEWHNLSNKGVHFNTFLDKGLKDYAQRVFENKYSHKLWMNEFGKSYLLDRPIFTSLKDFVEYGYNPDEYKQLYYSIGDIEEYEIYR